MLGRPPIPHRSPLVWSDQHGVRIQRVGDPRGATRAHDLTYVRDGRIAAVVAIDDASAIREARHTIQEAA